MKTKSSLRILCTGVALLFLSACAIFYPTSGKDALEGTWTNSVGTAWTIKADGTFIVDLNRDNKADAWGKYTVAGNTLTLWSTGGIKPRGCGGKAVYQFNRTDDETLQFRLVRDKCKLRRKNVLQVWHKK